MNRVLLLEMTVILQLVYCYIAFQENTHQSVPYDDSHVFAVTEQR